MRSKFLVFLMSVFLTFPAFGGMVPGANGVPSTFPDGFDVTGGPVSLPAQVRVAYRMSGANPGSYTAPNNFDLDTEDETIFSTVGTWSNDGAGVITIPETGLYHIEGLFGVSTGGWDTNTFFGINKNGTTIRDIVETSTAGDEFRVSWSIELELALNDTISVEADKGSALPVITGAIRNATRITIRKISE